MERQTLLLAHEQNSYGFLGGRGGTAVDKGRPNFPIFIGMSPVHTVVGCI